MAERCPHCGGTEITEGWCVRCGRWTEATPSRERTRRFRVTGPPLAAPPYTQRPSIRGFQGSQSTRTDRLGAGLVEVPRVETVQPGAAVLVNPRVAEENRFCWKCRSPVGRSGRDRPAPDKGFCPKCRAEFSFVPALQRGAMVSGKYEVAGCLAHGGQGWIYLARDVDARNRGVDHWVVLKGAVQPGDKDAVATAVTELQFLVQVQHRNVVRVYTAVEHAGNGYIVMEYLGGRTLRRVRKEGLPLPVAIAIAYVLDLLPAFAYLHERGLVYSDFKPDNAMVQDDREIKLIDLGGVRRLDGEGPILGTLGYQAPEVADGGLSVSSDLFTVARTLAELVLGTPELDGPLDPHARSLLDRHESLHRFLAKGAAIQPAERFQSAGEMAERLLSVLRQVVAVESGRPRPGASVLFDGDPHARYGAEERTWRRLPRLIPDSGDAAASLVADTAELDPGAREALLARAVADGRVPKSAEVRLRRALALIELGQTGQARELLAAIEADDAWDWRVTWYRSLSLLAENRAGEAARGFDLVQTDVPGELAPQLAEAMAAELDGDLARAARLYDAVVATDRSFTSAAVGLGRVREAQGDRAAAVAAYDLVPETSNARLPAQLAKARALVRRPPPGPEPAVADLVAAARVIDALPPERRRERAELEIELLETTLALFLADVLGAGVSLRGRTLEETRLRLDLEAAHRDLARLDPTADVDALINRANAVRPLTIF